MICSYCGREIPENSKYCSFCGRNLSNSGNLHSEKAQMKGTYEFFIRNKSIKNGAKPMKM